MSVYGYPREPEDTGDDIPSADLPYRVSSQPVSVPSTPAGSPPQPLLPPDPPGAPYPSLKDLIPSQRPADDAAASSTATVRPAAGGTPGLGVPAPGPMPLDDPEPSSSFDWLRPARPARPAASTDWHATAPGAAPTSGPPQWPDADPAPSPVLPGRPGSGPPASMGQPTAALSDPPDTGPAGDGADPADPGAAAQSPWSPDPPWSADPGGVSSSGAVPTAAGATGAVPTAAEQAGVERTGVTVTAQRDPAGGALPRDQPPPIIAPPPTPRDEPEIPPWDRKPLLVVIASAVVLVLIGIVSGVVTAALASSPTASWREAGTAPTPDPGAEATPGASAPPPAVAETITLSAVGDVIMGSVNLGTPPNNGSGFFDAVRDALAADLVTGNLDMALSDPTGYAKCSPGASDCFQLSLPPSYAHVLREGGFQLMTLANNHTQDQGPQGFTNTQEALTSAGIQHTGAVDQITYTTVKSVSVAVLGFSIYSYTANLNDIPRAAELVRQAADQADVVVVHMQGGAEGADRTRVPPAGEHEFFAGEDRGDLRGFAHAAVDAGADVVFGHGPHVMRGMEFYQGRLIAYSLGNFCGYAVLSSGGWSGVGGILKVTLRADGTWAGGELVATEMVDHGFPALDAELRALAFVDDLSVQDFGPAAARIDHTTGVITAP